MIRSQLRRLIWRKSPAVLSLAMLYLILCLCIPVTASAEESGGGGEAVAVEQTDADLSVGTEDVDISTPLAPPPGTAEIVEVEDKGQTTNQLDEHTSGVNGMETEFENDSPSVTFTETFNNQPGTDLTIDPGAEPDETAAYITDTMQPINVPAEGLIPETRDVSVVRDGDTLIRTTVSESDNAIQKAVSEALSKANSDTQSITIQVAAGEYNGDITIDKSGLAEDFILYILAEDSYTEPESEDELIDKTSIHTESQGNAIVTGNIIIAHINVIMAGLYLSQGQTIQVEDADVTYNGTVLAENQPVITGITRIEKPAAE